MTDKKGDEDRQDDEPTGEAAGDGAGEQREERPEAPAEAETGTTDTPTAEQDGGDVADSSGTASGDDAPSETPSSAAGRGRVLAVVALLVALAAGIGAVLGGYWLWRQQEAMAEAQTELASRSALEARNREVGQRLDELSARLANLNEQIGSRGQALADVRAAVEDLRQRQQAVEGRIGRVSELAQATRDDWRRSEAAYLANVAEQRLRFYQDVDAALGALKAADRLLAEFGGEAIEARKGVARAIDRLVEVDPPRRTAIADRLGGLIDTLDQLPSGPVPGAESGERTTAAAASGAGTGTGWRAGLARAWRNLKEGLSGLITVTREPEAVPLIAPEQHRLLVQNLRHELGAARMAALQGRQALYESSLSRVEGWLRRYLDADDPRVREVSAEISRLKAERVSVELPEIGPLLEPVRQFE